MQLKIEESQVCLPGFLWGEGLAGTQTGIAEQKNHIIWSSDIMKQVMLCAQKYNMRNADVDVVTTFPDPGLFATCQYPRPAKNRGDNYLVFKIEFPQAKAICVKNDTLVLKENRSYSSSFYE